MPARLLSSLMVYMPSLLLRMLLEERALKAKVGKLSPLREQDSEAIPLGFEAK
jgi:hypothetical protein